jgi:hypothetical protein
MRNINLAKITLAIILLISSLLVISISLADAGLTLKSRKFRVNAGTPNNLAFVQQPTTTTSGTAFNPVVTVRIRDAYNNNCITATNTITLTASAGATLGGTTAVAAVNGIVTFTDVTVSGSTASTYTLTALSYGLTSANSTTFGIASAVVTPTVTTVSATNLTSTTVVCSGNITDTGGQNCTERGFKYGLTQTDTWSVCETGTFGTGSYTLTITGLAPGTPYYIRAYATNTAVDTVSVSTQGAGNLASTSATGNGTITDLGGAANAANRGFKYGTTQTDKWGVSEIGAFNTGAYAKLVSGLSPGTLYYIRAFADNNLYGYGSYEGFTTPPPQVTIPIVTSPISGATNVSIGTGTTLSWGAVTGATSYGVYFGTSATPPFVITNTGVTNTTYTPTLVASTTYYWRIDSSNAGGTTIGAVWNFTTRGPLTATFNYTGGQQTWQVPAGIISITVDAKGAQGGNGGYGGVGGNGARVQTTLTVTPGQTLYIYVAGQGATPGAGYNGGGAGGGSSGGGGGGGSDIRIGGTALANRVVVAGGGGGGGYVGGAGGQNGASGDGAQPGGGGTQSAGGAAGGGTGATAGNLGQGGNGGAPNFSGGGGGGGYYGGGGGGGSSGTSGGGGGSSWTSGASPTYTSGYQSGNGQIIITY